MASGESSPVSRDVGNARQNEILARAIIYMLMSVFLFTSFNATAKWLAADFDALQIVFFRGLFGLLPVALLLLHDGGGPARLVSRRFDLQLLRAGTALGTNVCFILAYRSMPLADAVAIGYAAPIFVTVLSVPLLSERVGLHRWSAVVVGFLGVLLVAQPGVGVFDPAAIFAILGTIQYALMIIVTRRLGQIDPTVCTMAHSTILYVLACGLALPFVWITPSWMELLLFLFLGFVSGAGMFLFMQAFRHGEAATIAPFDYTAMGWAIVFGFIIWGDVPSWISLAGICVIVASGLYIMRREAVRRRAAPHSAELSK